ncbi:zinc finger and BTB domain-containing protein 8A-like [Myxocyprinus asiaticus]|uniref:zinc finger and BTB domain-containing protein 8A-like n=1 Tax=Myxocyprinus asiaticus TaxID=70543 RepID=UPI0022227E6E|nr:zinc finger and BTB domain-containing protein 8A-like [Myxocyprinus asiaticus]
MEMVCESGTSRSAGEAGHPPVQKWTSADMSAIHQSCLLKQLDQQRQQGLFCDCSILVEGQIFRTHRNVLHGSSGYFRMLLSQGAKDTLDSVNVSFDVFSPEIFSIILDFIYSGQLELNSSNVIEVMSAASYLQINDVISYCKTFIKSFLEISAKEDDENRYLCVSDSTPLQDRQENVIEPSTRLWKHEKDDQATEDISGAIASSPQPSGLQQNSPSQPSLEEQEEEMFNQFSFRTRRRRRNRIKTPEFATEDTEDTTLIDLQGVVSHCTQKADELYANLPSIVGIVGAFNKDSTPSMRYKCPFCTHTVKRKADLKRHLRCHTGERPYPCQECSKRFTRLEHLRSHFETIHQARKLVCRKCKRHVTEINGRVVSEGTRRYRLCNSCIQESGYSELITDRTDGNGEKEDMLLGVEEDMSENRQVTWVMDDDDLAEDSGADLIIQEVEDSDEDMSGK